MNAENIVDSPVDIIYELPTWQTCLMQLTQACARGQLVLLEGELGSGRSVMLGQLAGRLNASARVCTHKVGVSFDVAALVHQIINALALEVCEGQPPLIQLTSSLNALSLEDRPVYLLIDDADRLSRNALMTLVNWIGTQVSTHVTLVLSVETGFEAMLVRMMASESIETLMHAVTLPSLTLADTKAYLQAHLEAQGLWQGGRLPRGMVSNVYHLSSGLPGRINQVARQLVGQTSKYAVYIDIVRRYHVRILSMLILLLLAFGSVWYQHAGPPVVVHHAHRPAPVVMAPARVHASPSYRGLRAVSSDVKRVSLLTLSQQHPKTTIIPTLKESQSKSPIVHKPAYFIQLVGVMNPIPMTALLSKLHMHARLLKMQRQERPWYVFLSDDYASFHQAKMALSHLPATLKALHPWIRKQSLSHR